uniref:Selenoprotein T n=2 Tax=Timema TaxID=61471 RepID=A0A7R9DI98_TIMPO|nr:unnamed protein product [Timema poppensis]
MFEQYAEILQQKFPDISIHGDLYPPSDFMMLLAKFLGFGKMLLMICIIASINIFTYIGVQPMPSWYNWCISNKFYACMMIFFLCNALEGQVVSTGAFEIYYNGE